MFSKEICERARLARDPRFDGQFFRLADTMLNWRSIDPLTAVLGFGTIGLIVGFGFTRWARFSLILA